MGVEKGQPMPSYDILYRGDDGSLTAKVEAECANDIQAKVLAHAMKTADAKRIEVWDVPTLIYERPEPLRCAG